MTTAATYEIVAVDVRDHRRIQHVKIDTTAYRNLLLIAGKNGAGKTTLLDSLPAALGGAGELAADPIRRGASKAEITVKLRSSSGVEYTATRVVAAGKTSLKLVGPDGRIEPAQTWLDDLLAGRTLDPASFLRKLAADQRATLLELLDIDTSALDAEHDRAYSKRTEENRVLKAARAQRAAVPDLVPLPAHARPTAEIQADVARLEAADRDHATVVVQRDRVAAGLEQVRNQAAALRAEIERLQAELAKVNDRETRGVIALTDADRAVAEVAARTDPARLAELRAEAARAQDYAIAAAKNAEREREAARLDAEIAKREAESKRLTEIVDGTKAKKAELLASKPMPVDGLGVDDQGLTLAGEDGPVPFDQASHAQRLRCALAIAMLQAGKLRDVWLRDGSLLDEDGLAAVRELAERYDRRVWLEVVGERRDEPDAIIIRAGKVLAPGGEP